MVDRGNKNAYYTFTHELRKKGGKVATMTLLEIFKKAVGGLIPYDPKRSHNDHDWNEGEEEERRKKHYAIPNDSLSSPHATNKLQHFLHNRLEWLEGAKAKDDLDPLAKNKPNDNNNKLQHFLHKRLKWAKGEEAKAKTFLKKDILNPFAKFFDRVLIKVNHITDETVMLGEEVAEDGTLIAGICGTMWWIFLIILAIFAVLAVIGPMWTLGLLGIEGVLQFGPNLVNEGIDKLNAGPVHIIDRYVLQEMCNIELKETLVKKHLLDIQDTIISKDAVSISESAFGLKLDFSWPSEDLGVYFAWPNNDIAFDIKPLWFMCDIDKVELPRIPENIVADSFSFVKYLKDVDCFGYGTGAKAITTILQIVFTKESRVIERWKYYPYIAWGIAYTLLFLLTIPLAMIPLVIKRSIFKHEFKIEHEKENTLERTWHKITSPWAHKTILDKMLTIISVSSFVFIIASQVFAFIYILRLDVIIGEFILSLPSFFQISDVDGMLRIPIPALGLVGRDELPIEPIFCSVMYMGLPIGVMGILSMIIGFLIMILGPLFLIFIMTWQTMQLIYMFFPGPLVHVFWIMVTRVNHGIDNTFGMSEYLVMVLTKNEKARRRLLKKNKYLSKHLKPVEHFLEKHDIGEHHHRRRHLPHNYNRYRGRSHDRNHNDNNRTPKRKTSRNRKKKKHENKLYSELSTLEHGAELLI